MRFRMAFILLLSLLSVPGGKAQISYGGTPLFLENTRLRSTGNNKIVEMPTFDLDSVLRVDKLNESNMRGSFQFAYKFYTHINKGQDGTTTILPDGTKVWHVTIHSSGAYSLNFLFTKYHLPEGGKLFIYNTDHSHVIGAFDHRNNSTDNILPTRPIDGESIVIEYIEPANVDFEGELEIGEVNHDYRDVLRREPGTDNTSSWKGTCMLDVLCSDADESTIRSTVLLMINGNAACTGSLINNTSNDSTPYLLTAVHCLNDSIEHGISHNNDWYVNRAGTIVTFFNYNRPVCGTLMKATEELSLAIAYPRVILENKDIALLELQQQPPAYYNAYYAGWNVNTTPGQAPYTNIHHPTGAVKKFGEYDGVLSKYSATDSPLFDSNSHWKVTSWNIGSTAGGSSGSPLFDYQQLIVGGLTGGTSYCSNTNPNGSYDYFFALNQGWNNAANANNQLKTYLDPDNTGVLQYAGYDPNEDYQLSRIGNADYNAGDTLTKTVYSAPNSGLLFGKSNLNNMEFAEEFATDSTATLEGVFVLLPRMGTSSGVEIKIYAGENAPETLIDSQPFQPKYLNYSGGNFVNANKSGNIAGGTENFVRFNSLPMGKKFYVGYSITSATLDTFAVYNTSFNAANNPISRNTAWIKDAQDVWTKASEYAANPMATSLAIQPLLHFTPISSIINNNDKKNINFIYLREENKLILPKIANDKGMLYLYNITGQLVQQIEVPQGQDEVTLKQQIKNSVGLVRLVRGNQVYTGKIIY